MFSNDDENTVAFLDGRKISTIILDIEYEKSNTHLLLHNVKLDLKELIM